MGCRGEEPFHKTRGLRSRLEPVAGPAAVTGTLVPKPPVINCRSSAELRNFPAKSSVQTDLTCSNYAACLKSAPESGGPTASFISQPSSPRASPGCLLPDCLRALRPSLSSRVPSSQPRAQRVCSAGEALVSRLDLAETRKLQSPPDQTLIITHPAAFQHSPRKRTFSHVGSVCLRALRPPWHSGWRGSVVEH